MKERLSQLKSAYKVAKSAKVGEVVNFPSCRTYFVKTSYQQAFCKSKPGTTCKDYYWNNVTPNKRNNTTRISPASAAYMAKQSMLLADDDDDDDGDIGYYVDGEYM